MMERDKYSHIYRERGMETNKHRKNHGPTPSWMESSSRNTSRAMMRSEAIRRKRTLEKDRGRGKILKNKARKD